MDVVQDKIIIQRACVEFKVADKQLMSMGEEDFRGMKIPDDTITRFFESRQKYDLKYSDVPSKTHKTQMDSGIIVKNRNSIRYEFHKSIRQKQYVL